MPEEIKPKLLKVGDIMVVEKNTVAQVYIRDGLKAGSFQRVYDATEVAAERKVHKGAIQGKYRRDSVEGSAYVVVALQDEILAPRTPWPWAKGFDLPFPKSEVTLVEFRRGAANFTGSIIRVIQSIRYDYPELNGYIDKSIHARIEVGITSMHPAILNKRFDAITRMDVPSLLEKVKQEALAAKEKAKDAVIAEATAEDVKRPLAVRARPEPVAQKAVA